MHKPPSRLVQAELLLDEANSRLQSTTRRLASIEQRLGILVGSSAIAGALATATDKSGWTTGALGAIAVGAILGVVGLIPREFPELPWSETRPELYALEDEAATLRLADRRLDLANQRESRIKAKAILLSVGFSFLVAAIVLLFASALGIVVTWT